MFNTQTGLDFANSYYSNQTTTESKLTNLDTKIIVKMVKVAATARNSDVLYQTDSIESVGETLETSIDHRDDSIDHSNQKILLSQQSSSPSTEGTSTLGSIFLIVNAALGAGILNFPKAFDMAGGVLTGLVVQALLVVFIMLGLMIRAKTSDLQQSPTLQDVMDTTAGPWGRRATAAIVTVYCFGRFCLHQSDKVSEVFLSVWRVHHGLHSVTYLLRVCRW